MQQTSDENQQWPQDLNQDNFAGGASDVDFTKFLELGNDFVNFENVDQQQQPQHQHPHPHATASGLDTPMGRLTFSPNGHVQALSPEQAAMLQNMDLEIASLHAQLAYPQLQQQQSSAPSQQFQQYPVYQQMQQPYQHQVPPTPVSNEMQANKFVASMDPTGQIIFERQQASFTPLVSPAQTPIDNAWAMPDYVLNDDFFSPLTSPAIEAQTHYASTNTTSSPVDLTSEQPAARKSRRKLNPTSRVASTRTARSSPTTKAMTKRRQGSLGASGKDALASDVVRPPHLLPSQPASSEDSVSPEPLAESLMRPPPIPQSRTPNTLRGQSREGNAPATPATLMKVAGRNTEVITNVGRTVGSPEIMEDITLPPAADTDASRILPGLDTQIIREDDSSTPTLSAKTPKLNADDTPRSAGARQSAVPQDSNKPTRGGRTSKKRQSISQATISPALRPKISPSISPLVPSTSQGIPMISPETSALYLASKSNYQNIIDGTHLPGVSYPETLAENLSSKRTSHKLAEQGRRNRINLALKEIETLLPASIMASNNKKEKSLIKEESGDGSDKLGASQGTSKASTVEMAIVYIKSLQAELKETRDKLEVAEKNLADGTQNTSDGQSSESTST